MIKWACNSKGNGGMAMVEKAGLSFGAVRPFKVQVSYMEIDGLTPADRHDQHIHAECEIYFNLSGDVSFMVEDRVYPISPGSVILTRPYENHHCIYHSPTLHRHFCVFFSCEGNEAYFPLFFDRAVGEGNLRVLSSENTAVLSALLREMMVHPLSPAEGYLAFARMMALLESGAQKSDENVRLSAEITQVLETINRCIVGPLSISMLAEEVHMSVNSFERHFKRQIGVTPREYIQKKRMARAVQLLDGGASVMEACAGSGFTDYSYFIMQFRRQFGVTPYQYKKRA